MATHTYAYVKAVLVRSEDITLNWTKTSECSGVKLNSRVEVSFVASREAARSNSYRL